MDTNELRRAAKDLEMLAPTKALPPEIAHAHGKLRDAAEEIDRLRAACASLDPRPADRLMRYRCAAMDIIGPALAAGRFGTVVDGLMPKVGAKDMAVSCEEIAHAMLAAERPPAATMATARPTVTEAQIDSWVSAALNVYDDDPCRGRSGFGVALRHVLTLAGVIESAEKGAGK